MIAQADDSHFGKIPNGSFQLWGVRESFEGIDSSGHEPLTVARQHSGQVNIFVCGWACGIGDVAATALSIGGKLDAF